MTKKITTTERLKISLSPIPKEIVVIYNYYTQFEIVLSTKKRKAQSKLNSHIALQADVSQRKPFLIVLYATICILSTKNLKRSEVCKENSKNVVSLKWLATYWLP